MSKDQLEHTLFEDVKRKGTIDPNEAIDQFTAQQVPVEQVREAIVRLVDRHKLTFTRDCKLAVAQ